MKVTRDKIENHQAYLTIEMEPAELQKSLNASYQRLVKRVNIPGFRKGKAPQPIIERYLGREQVLEDALNYLVPEAYEQALKEQDIHAAANPQIEITQTEPVIFKATVPLAPTIELGEYTNIKLVPEAVQVTDEDVKNALDVIRHQYATWEPVDRPVAFNDLASLDIESNAEGQPLINQKGAQYQVISDTANPVKGFAEQIAGMTQGEEKEFKLALPEDYPRKELASKEATFKVKVTGVKEEKLPELNDELAHQINPEFKSFDALREQVTKNLKTRAEQKSKTDFEEKALDAVVGQAKVEYPPALVEAEVDSMLNEQIRRIQMAGMDIDDYIKSLKKSEKEVREGLRPVAAKRLVRELVLGKLAAERKIEVSEEDIDRETAALVSSSRKAETEKMLGTPRARESVRQYLLTQKSIQWLVDSARTEAEGKENDKGGEK